MLKCAQHSSGLQNLQPGGLMCYGAQTLMHAAPRRSTQCLQQTTRPAPPCTFRQVIRAPGRHGSVRATKEAALQALAETKARVSQAMEDTVAIKSGDSIDEVPGALTWHKPPPPCGASFTPSCSSPLTSTNLCPGQPLRLLSMPRDAHPAPPS